MRPVFRLPRAAVLAGLLALGACAGETPPEHVFAVFFANFATQLDTQGQSVVARAAAAANRFPNLPVTVTGYADPSDTTPAGVPPAGRGAGWAGHRDADRRRRARQPDHTQADRRAAEQPSGASRAAASRSTSAHPNPMPDGATLRETPRDVLRRVFGYPAFRGHQEAAVEQVVGGGRRAWC